MLTNGSDVRRYVENNGFGFAPAYGFGEQATKSYTMGYRAVGESEIQADGCNDLLKGTKSTIQLCSSFGSRSPFFGTSPSHRGTLVAHYALQGSLLEQDFAVADMPEEVENIFFLPPPDAPGGTLTLIMTDQQGTYRAFIDTPRG